MDTSGTDLLKPCTSINIRDQKLDQINDESGILISRDSHESEDVRRLRLKDTELNDRQKPQSPPPAAEKNTNIKKNIDLSTSSYSPNHMIKNVASKMESIRETIRQAEQDHGKVSPAEVRESASLPWSPPLNGQSQQWSSVRNREGNDIGCYIERGRLPKVVEESESFSMREFGSNLLIYMSTAHSSANHELNFANHGSLYDYRNRSPVSPYATSSSFQTSNNLVGSKSAPAGGDVASAFRLANLRRGQSDASHMRTAMPQHHRYAKHRKPKTLKSTLMWPLLKIRDVYVGCMMGLEGAGDLTAMTQGSNYSSAERYFADVPLSKTDSRNYG